MKQTREQALEAALQVMVDHAKHFISRPDQSDIAQAEAALAIPPDSVNADMLAALQTLVTAYDAAKATGRANIADISFALQEAMPKFRAAIARATGREG